MVQGIDPVDLVMTENTLSLLLDKVFDIDGMSTVFVGRVQHAFIPLLPKRPTPCI